MANLTNEVRSDDAKDASVARVDLRLEIVVIPAGTIHTATNVGSGNGAELATYVVEKGKPLITLVK